MELKGNDAAILAVLGRRQEGMSFTGSYIMLKPSSLRFLTSEYYDSANLLSIPWSRLWPSTPPPHPAPLTLADIYENLLYLFCFGQQETRTRREFEIVRSVRTKAEEAISKECPEPGAPSAVDLLELRLINYWNDAVESQRPASNVDRNLFARTFITLSLLTSFTIRSSPEWEKFSLIAQKGAFDMDYYRRFEFAVTHCSAEYSL